MYNVIAKVHAGTEICYSQFNSNYQIGILKRGYLSDAKRKIQDMIDFVDEANQERIVISFDQRKDFDMEWE